MGPRALKGNRLDYNVSVQKSNNEELLLNLVRANYMEPLFFLQVGSISSSFSYELGVGGEATFFDRDKAPAFWSGRGTAGFSERPTITYTPIQGEQAVKQFLEEISLERFVLLTRAGWNIESLLWVMADRIGELANFDPAMAGEAEAPYLRFLQFNRLLSGIQKRGDLEVAPLGKDGKVLMQLRYADPREAEELESLLGVRLDKLPAAGGKSVVGLVLCPTRDLSDTTRKGEAGIEVPVRLKSCFGTLYHLAWFLGVPPEHAAKGLNRKAPPLPERFSQWKGPHSGLVQVHSSDLAPEGAFVAVAYRGTWYSIADDDVRSKNFFVLLGTLFSLQAGEIRALAPLLTLPVNR
jgi:hypothetical protein